MNAGRIGKLESLLSRVLARKDAPRPVRIVPQRAASAAVVAARAPMSPPAATAAKAEMHPSLSAEIPMVRPFVPAPIPARDARDLPDLDFVETDTSTGRRPSLVPSSMPAPSGETTGMEFDIPGTPATPSVAPSARDASVEFDVSTDVASTESVISREPLASALPPRVETPAPMAAIQPPSAVIPTSAHAPGSIAEHAYTAAPLASSEAVQMRGAIPSPRAATFRGMLQRSLGLVAKPRA